MLRPVLVRREGGKLDGQNRSGRSVGQLEQGVRPRLWREAPRRTPTLLYVDERDCRCSAGRSNTVQVAGESSMIGFAGPAESVSAIRPVNRTAAPPRPDPPLAERPARRVDQLRALGSEPRPPGAREAGYGRSTTAPAGIRSVSQPPGGSLNHPHSRAAK